PSASEARIVGIVSAEVEHIVGDGETNRIRNFYKDGKLFAVRQSAARDLRPSVASRVHILIIGRDRNDWCQGEGCWVRLRAAVGIATSEMRPRAIVEGPLVFRDVDERVRGARNCAYQSCAEFAFIEHAGQQLRRAISELVSHKKTGAHD